MRIHRNIKNNFYLYLIFSLPVVWMEVLIKTASRKLLSGRTECLYFGCVMVKLLSHVKSLNSGEYLQNNSFLFLRLTVPKII